MKEKFNQNVFLPLLATVYLPTGKVFVYSVVFFIIHLTTEFMIVPQERLCKTYLKPEFIWM